MAISYEPPIVLQFLIKWLLMKYSWWKNRVYKEFTWCTQCPDIQLLGPLRLPFTYTECQLLFLPLYFCNLKPSAMLMRAQRLPKWCSLKIGFQIPKQNWFGHLNKLYKSVTFNILSTLPNSCLMWSLQRSKKKKTFNNPSAFALFLAKDLQKRAKRVLKLKSSWYTGAH